MKYTSIFILLVTLTACGDEVIPTEVRREKFDCQDKTALAEFVLTCAKNANPLSDEEGEDLVKQCENTGKSLFCTAKTVLVKCSNGWCYDKDGNAY